MDTVVKALVWIGATLLVVCLGAFFLLSRYGDQWVIKEAEWQASQNDKREMQDGVNPMASGWKPPPLEGGEGATGSSAPAEEMVDLRVEHRLTDRKNRSIDVVITGRSPTSVIFEGKGRTWTWPIHELSEEDQKFVRKLPVNQP